MMTLSVTPPTGEQLLADFSSWRVLSMRTYYLDIQFWHSGGGNGRFVALQIEAFNINLIFCSVFVCPFLIFTSPFHFLFYCEKMIQTISSRSTPNKKRLGRLRVESISAQILSRGQGLEYQCMWPLVGGEYWNLKPRGMLRF